MSRRTKNCIRTTISIPQTVKDRMDEMGGVNWSALATDAFRKRLDGDVSIEIASEVRDLERRLEALKARCGMSDRKQETGRQDRLRSWLDGVGAKFQWQEQTSDKQIYRCYVVNGVRILVHDMYEHGWEIFVPASNRNNVEATLYGAEFACKLRTATTTLPGGWAHRDGRPCRHSDSVVVGYDPVDDASAAGYRRPPRVVGCVLDYFAELGKIDDGGTFAVSEMKAMLDDPSTFFTGDP
jgi:hypothetical protein